MPKARTHVKNRLCICLFCFNKSKSMFPIKGAVEKLVKKYFNYDDKDERLPSVLCSACKRDLYRVRNDENCKVYLPEFSQLPSLKMNTRSTANDVCNCVICHLARKPSSKFSNFAKGDTLPVRKSILSDVCKENLPSK